MCCVYLWVYSVGLCEFGWVLWIFGCVVCFWMFFCVYLDVFCVILCVYLNVLCVYVCGRQDCGCVFGCVVCICVCTNLTLQSRDCWYTITGGLGSGFGCDHPDPDHQIRILNPCKIYSNQRFRYFSKEKKNKKSNLDPVFFLKGWIQKSGNCSIYIQRKYTHIWTYIYAKQWRHCEEILI